MCFCDTKLFGRNYLIYIYLKGENACNTIPIIPTHHDDKTIRTEHFMDFFFLSVCEYKNIFFLPLLQPRLVATRSHVGCWWNFVADNNNHIIFNRIVSRGVSDQYAIIYTPREVKHPKYTHVKHIIIDCNIYIIMRYTCALICFFPISSSTQV